MPGQMLWGWYPEGNEWVKLRVDVDGSFHVVGYIDKLEDIGDVILTAIANNDILYWDATGKWKNIAHLGVADAHHAKYTNAEAKAAAVQAGAITDEVTKAPTHDAVYDVAVIAAAALPAVDRYDDAEAVSAMGVKGDANPLHHDRAAEWGATEHTAVGNNAPHHTKYTNNEAKAAAVQAGAITNGVTKAPTHDAVFDVKATADAAQPAATDAAAAVTAMGAKADGNPLHHDRTVKYTGGEAVTAVENAGLGLASGKNIRLYAPLKL